MEVLTDPAVAVVLTDVAVLRWPMEADRRAQLVEEGVPRLLVVDLGSRPPLPEDCLEDWVAAAAPESEVRARVAGLGTRRRLLDTADPPHLDPDGVLRMGGRWVALPPVEARLTSALLGRFGAVVSRDNLAGAGWPDGAPGRNALDVHVLRLRRRIAPLGLIIQTVRARGYLLERDVLAGDASTNGYASSR
ncbi:MAG TPA: helix-turn-helix domain-containing protein [Acidimicrobiales bacterium]|nr:helix-turn-helix domain-containing protein [Acidimicrobiales bacterium]